LAEIFTTQLAMNWCSFQPIIPL